MANFGLEKYEAMRLRDRTARMAALEEMALYTLRADIQSVADLGGGQYELAISLSNSGSDQPIYVMAPEMRVFVQIGKRWDEMPMQPAEETGTKVRQIDGDETFRYVFDARVQGFAQLLPNYMHVRFSDTMLVSPSSTPGQNVFERKDNYYVYLKSYEVPDEVVLKRIRFPGKPPVWIPMPPH